MYAVGWMAWGASLSMYGCVSNQANGLSLVANIAPNAAMDCAVSPESTSFVPIGTLDTSVPTAYVLSPLVANELAATAGSTITEEHRVLVDTVEIDLTSPDLPIPAAFAKLTQPTSGAVEPAGGKTTFAVELVPLDVVRALRGLTGTINAAVRVRGSMVNGGEASSNVFNYPVRVCDGCLVQRIDCVAAATTQDKLNEDQCGFQDQTFKICQ
jgi:hypothetical protein